jgi:hypothetical protein
MVVYPSLHDIAARFPNVQPGLIGNDIAYPAMLVYLPSGFAGLMVAGLFAAYRSTMETHLNWGTSYLVHDFYQRYIRPGASERHLVLAGRIGTVVLMLLGVALTPLLDNAKEAFNLLLSIGAGTGLIYLLRWFWWRINAWSEVSAMASSFLIAAAFFIAGKLGYLAGLTEDQRSIATLLATVVTTSIVWVAVTFLTPPAADETLVAFYRKVRPAGPGWARIRALAGVGPAPDSPTLALLGWVLGLASIYGALFATGGFVYGRPGEGTAWLAVALAGIAGLFGVGRRLWGSPRNAEQAVE